MYVMESPADLTPPSEFERKLERLIARAEDVRRRTDLKAHFQKLEDRYSDQINQLTAIMKELEERLATVAAGRI